MCAVTGDPRLSMSDSELLSMLGEELLGPGVGFGPDDPDRLRRFAERWLARHVSDIQNALCGKAEVRAVFEKDLQERLDDAAIVADALSALRGNPPVTTLAVVLVRRGYEAVCGG